MKDQKEYLPMIMATGKGINDLGDPDACTQDPNMDFATLGLRGVPVYIGV